MDRIVQDLNNVAAWHFFTFSPMCFLLPTQGGRLGVEKLRFKIQSFFWRLGGILGETFVVRISPNDYFTFSPLCSNGDIPLEASSFSSHLGPHCLCWNLTLRWARDYVRATKAFTPLVPTFAFSETINILQTFHPPNLSLPCSIFLMEFQLKVDLEFILETWIKSTFIYTTF